MDKITVKIDDLDYLGLGLAHLDNKVVFVDNALPSENIECEIIKEKNNLIWAKNLKILNSSKFRVSPLCPYFNICGGCDLQHLEYNKTLEFKKNQIKLAFKKIANISLDDFEIIKSENHYFYRNKIAMKISKINNEKVLSFYKKNSHIPIKIESCKLIDSKFDFVINSVNEFLKKCDNSVYDEKTKKGDLKHLVCRLIDNNILITFVLNSNAKFENIECLYSTLKTKFNLVGINKNINNKDKEILSTKFIHLIGENKLEFTNNDIIQPITNGSFLQVNLDVSNKIYNYVLKNLNGNVVNCYSGAGLLSAIIAKNNTSQVYGIEISIEATRLADKIKEENKINNLTNFCGDAGKVLKELNLKDFSLVLDPPRSGIDDNMISVIKSTLPNKIVYISCDKNSLAKNIKQLINLYDINEIKAFDMFAQTKNVETVIVLTKK